MSSKSGRSRRLAQGRLSQGVGGPEDPSNMEMALRASRQAWCDMGTEQMALAAERSLQARPESDD